MPDAGDGDLAERSIHSMLEARWIEGGKHPALLERNGGERDIHGKLCLHAMTKMGAGRAHRNGSAGGQKGALRGGGGFGAGGSRNDREPVRVQTWGDALP